MKIWRNKKNVTKIQRDDEEDMNEICVYGAADAK